jgi:hypothetical protein
LKISSQYDTAVKAIRVSKREISFMEEKIAEIQRKSGKPQKKQKTEEIEDSLLQPASVNQ